MSFKKCNGLNQLPSHNILYIVCTQLQYCTEKQRLNFRRTAETCGVARVAGVGGVRLAALEAQVVPIYETAESSEGKSVR